MINRKQYWLGAAALLVTGISGAQAADLPFRKAAPVEYVRICDAFGEGFFYIPGTDTCLRVAGQIRAEYTFRGKAPTDNPGAFAYNLAGTQYRRDLTSFRARGYLNTDARTQTAYGTLRSFVSIRINKDSTNFGPIGGRGALGFGGAPAGSRASTGLFQGGDSSGFFTTLDKGFIQFAGITAGRAQSFFDFDAQSYELLTNSVANSNQVTNLFAYTATFGGGFSATISVEDANERRIGDNGLFTFSTFNPYAPATPGFNTGNINSPTFNTTTNIRTGAVFAYAGERIPDIVGNVRYDAPWGSAQLSGAYHQLDSAPVAALTGRSTATFVQGANQTPGADGFAVLGGVKVLLPMIAKGDSVTFQGTYQSGAMDYANSVNYLPVGLTNIYESSTTGVGGVSTVPLNDAYYVTRANGSIAIAKSEAYGGYAAFRHYFIPAVYGSLFGAYLQINDPPQGQRLGAGMDNARIFQVGGNVVWTPIKDTQIGAEALYSNMLYSGLAATAANTAGNTTRSNPDDYRARLSFRRAF